MNSIKTIAMLAGLATFAVMTAEASAQVWTRMPTSVPSSECRLDAGFMRTVRTDEIAMVRNQPVLLIPVCEEQGMPRNDYGTLFIDGNAQGLRSVIAGNDQLMAALGDGAYDQNDVVSVRFGANDSVLLYVHQRDMR